MRHLPDGGEAILKRIAARPNLDVQIMACAALFAVDEPFALSALARIAETAAGLKNGDLLETPHKAHVPEAQHARKRPSMAGFATARRPVQYSACHQAS